VGRNKLPQSINGLGKFFLSGGKTHQGQSTLFLFTGVVHGLTGILAYYRITQRERVPIEERENFIAIPLTSPEVSLLDPRSEEHPADALEASKP